MSVHRNARLTVQCRALLLERVLRGEPRVQAASQVCDFGKDGLEVAEAVSARRRR